MQHLVVSLCFHNINFEILVILMFLCFLFGNGRERERERDAGACGDVFYLTSYADLLNIISDIKIAILSTKFFVCLFVY